MAIPGEDWGLYGSYSALEIAVAGEYDIRLVSVNSPWQLVSWQAPTRRVAVEEHSSHFVSYIFWGGPVE
jgi:hypothetical protein